MAEGKLMSRNLISFINSVMENNNIPIKCVHCGYKWEYTGSMERATCPSCSRKNNVSEQRLDK